MKNIYILLSISLISFGCANQSLKSDTFQRDSVQRISNVQFGEIISLKNVNIEGSNKSGSIVGGLIGAAAGSGVSDSRPESEIGAIIGGAIGATIGGELSKNIQSVNGLQITISTTDGRTISIVQEVSDYNFDVGDKVEIITIKGKTRVSPSR
tara:strand:- start:25227 stop:25685 length:459 start_codon:yes stop_codon:yes gene_type:complete